MKMLLMFVVAAVLSGLSESSNITRCELKIQLEATHLPLAPSPNGPTAGDIVARIVCHVEKSTGFNTSAVSQLTLHGVGAPPMRGKREAKGKGSKPASKASKSSEESSEEHRNANSVTQKPQTPATKQQHQQVWTLYGLFQLSDHVICSDGVTPSPNICGRNCTDFLDHAITDDIACLGTTIAALNTTAGRVYADDLLKMFNLLYQKECDNVVASQYFSAC